MILCVALVLAAALAFVCYAYYKLGLKVLELEEQVEESLDVLDMCYSRISEAAMTPVASDDPVVVEVVKSVKDSKDAVLLVANKLIKFTE